MSRTYYKQKQLTWMRDWLARKWKAKQPLSDNIHQFLYKAGSTARHIKNLKEAENPFQANKLTMLEIPWKCSRFNSKNWSWQKSTYFRESRSIIFVLLPARNTPTHKVEVVISEKSRNHGNTSLAKNKQKQHIDTFKFTKKSEGCSFRAL